MLEKIADLLGFAKKQGKWKILKNCQDCTYWQQKRCVLKGSKRTQVCECWERR